MAASVFFDLDGTLTDPARGITRSIRYAFERLDVPPPPAAALRELIGPPLLRSFERLLDEERAPVALAFYRERFAATGLYENEVYAGIPEALAELLEAGRRLYVASSKPQVFVERILAHFGLARFFDAAFGSELDGTRSDKSELLRHALARTGVQAAEATMVGDREHDVFGATDNGLAAVGVLYGYGSRGELLAAGAARIARSPADLPGALM